MKNKSLLLILATSALLLGACGSQKASNSSSPSGSTNQNDSSSSSQTEGQTDQEAAQAVIDLINTLPSIDSLTRADKPKLEAARVAYDALTAAQKALVTNLSVLEALEAKMAELDADYQDYLAAQAVIDLINALPSVENLTKEDEEALLAARAAYDALTATQKALVTNLSVLEALESQMRELKKTLQDLINDLDVVGSYSAEYGEKINSLRSQYNALTEEEQAKIDASNLIKAEAHMYDYKSFNSESDIENIRTGVYWGDSPAVLEKGFTAEVGGKDGGFAWFSSKIGDPNHSSDDTNGNGYYDDGGWARSKILPMHDKSIYQQILAKGNKTITLDIYQEAEAGRFGYWNDFGNRWNGITSNEWHTFEISLDKVIEKWDDINKETQPSAIFGFDLNTATPLTKVYISNITIRDDATVNKQKAERVIAMINALPEADALTKENGTALNEARAAYDALTEEQKALVTNLATLEALEAKMDKIYADEVVSMIAALPTVEELKASDNEALVAARTAYDALTEEQKALVTNLATLEALEAKMIEINAAGVMQSKIDALAITGSYAFEDLEKIMSVREQYEELDASVKSQIDTTKLEKAEEHLFSYKTFDAESDIENIRTGVYWGDSPAVLEKGFTAEVGGKDGGFAWFSSKVGDPENASDDTNGNGYYDDSGWARSKILPMHDKGVYEKLYEMGYEKITFDIYQEAETGSFGYWNDLGDRWNAVSSNEWHTFEISLATVIEKWDDINKETQPTAIFGFDLNTATPLTKVYISNLKLKLGDVSDVSDLVAKIDNLTLSDAPTLEEVQAALPVIKEYQALNNASKNAVTNKAKLQDIINKVLVYRKFSSASDLDYVSAGWRYSNNPDTMGQGYVEEVGGRKGGFLWFSSEVTCESSTYDSNGNGYYDDTSYGRVRITPQFTKDYYQAMLDAGFTKVSFDFYQEAESSSWGIWSDITTARLNRTAVNQWITYEISLQDFITNYDATTGGNKGAIIAFDANTATKLTKLYMTSIVIK